MKITKREDIIITISNRLKDYVGNSLFVFGVAKEDSGEEGGFTSVYNSFDTLQRHLLGIIDIDYMEVTHKECKLFYRIGTTYYTAQIGVIIKDNMFPDNKDLANDPSLLII